MHKTGQPSDDHRKAEAPGCNKMFAVIFSNRTEMSGDIDYLLKVVAKDIADYDRIYHKLTKVAPLHDVGSSFAMQEIKSVTALPLY